MQREEYKKIIAMGVRVTMKAALRVRGEHFTPDEIEDRRIPLKESLLNQLQPHFEEEGVTRDQAIELINEVVDEVLQEFS